MKRLSIEDKQTVLNSVKGQSITACLRLFSESGFEDIPEDKREQEADGSTYLIFSNGEILGFHPISESFTIHFETITRDELPRNLSDVSGNQFWQDKVGQIIINIELLYATFDVPYGVRFSFKNGKSVELQYVSESAYTFDALIVQG